MLKTTAHSSLLAERLRRSEVFGAICLADCLEIAEMCSEETYDEGESILVEGESAKKLYIIERGKVSLEKKVQLGRHSTPRNATINYIVPFKITGFSALVSPYIYTTSAICVEPVRVIAIDGHSLRSYLDAHPAVGLKVMDELTALIGDRYRQATSTLTYFLSVVSHELRSPLAAVENYLQVMLEGYAGDLTPKQERMIQRSIVRVTDLRGQIGDIVDLARMRPEQIQTDFTWYDFKEVGNQAIEDVRLAAAERDIRIYVEPPTVFEPIVGAPRRMRQVFTNLLNNAIRYSPPGTTVTFRAWFEADEMVVEVEDQGPGIDPEDMPHIFKDFFRSSSTGDAPGMGLGLSIAKKIIDAHSGQILVRNLPDESPGGEDDPPGDAETPTGTCFTVRVPRNLQTAEMRRQKWMESASDG
jgi:signal transduction histidine kinase